MFARRTVLLLFILAVPTLSAQAAPATPAQAEKTDASGPSISMAASVAVPDTRVAVMVRLDGDFGGPIQSMTMEVDFPAAQLSFLEARPAFSQDFPIETKVTPSPDQNGKSRLRVTATSAKPIAVGDAIELVFQVAKTVYTNQDAVLTGVSAALETAEGQALNKVTVKDGKVEISVAAIVFGCFFYMH